MNSPRISAISRIDRSASAFASDGAERGTAGWAARSGSPVQVRVSCVMARSAPSAHDAPQHRTASKLARPPGEVAERLKALAC